MEVETSVGTFVGVSDGRLAVGNLDVCNNVEVNGISEGLRHGSSVGVAVAVNVCAVEGTLVGHCEGDIDGQCDGELLGFRDGEWLG